MSTTPKNCELRLIPPDVASEQDTLEIRVQYKNRSSVLNIDLWFGNEFVNSVIGEKGSGWHLAVLRLPLAGRRGKLKISVHLTTISGSTSVEQEIDVVQALPAILQGGFVMLGAPADRKPCDPFRDAVMGLDDAGWQQQVDGWNRLGMKTLVLFDTIFPASLREGRFQSYYPSKLLPKAPVCAIDPIAAILEAATRNKQQVFMGMCAWPGAGDNMISELLEELYERYGHFPSFYGWYASSEFPTSGVCFDATAEYFSLVRSRISKFGPALPLLTSPYQPAFSFEMNPEVDFNSTDFAQNMLHGLHPNFARLLSECSARPDILMPQDGVGQRIPIPRHRDLIEFNHRAYAAFREACDKARIHPWANVESFDFSEEQKLLPRFVSGGFDGEKGLVQQLESVYANVEKILTFSLPGFFAPPGVEPAIGGVPAKKQADQYAKYLKHPRQPLMNLALGKTYTCDPAPSRLLPDHIPGKLTDGLLSGGYAVDVDSDRMLGYDSRQADANGDLSVCITLDLEAVKKFSRVRIGGSIRRLRGRADNLTVAVPTNPEESWQELGTASTYRFGWMGLELPEPAPARWVRLTLHKHFKSDIFKSWSDSWLLLDEIQIQED